MFNLQAQYSWSTISYCYCYKLVEPDYMKGPNPDGPALKNFLASQMSIDSEPFPRTDIGMKPLGPTKNKNVRKMDPRTLDAFFEFQKYNLAPAENFGLQ
jgi:hypothetical protein